MNTWLIDPRYFCAYAAAAEDDADLPKGTHLRLFPSSSIGFPLAPSCCGRSTRGRSSPFPSTGSGAMVVNCPGPIWTRRAGRCSVGASPRCPGMRD